MYVCMNQCMTLCAFVYVLKDVHDYAHVSVRDKPMQARVLRLTGMLPDSMAVMAAGGEGGRGEESWFLQA